MKDLLLPLLHLAVTAAKLCRPGGVRAVIAENLLLKQQLIVLRRSRQRAPNLRVGDRLLCGFGALFLSPGRIRTVAIGLRPSTLLTCHQALVRGKYRRLFSSSARPKKPGPQGPSESLIRASVELKSRNPRFGCPRIARIISQTFGVDIDKNVVHRVLAKRYRPAPGGTGPSWLSFVGHTTDSLWSVDLLRCASIVLQRDWVLVVMDQFTRRLVGVGVHRGPVDAPSLCRMCNAAIHGRGAPRHLSTDHDPLFEAHRWTANLRLLEIDEIKTVPHVPLSHPFVERLIGTMRREFLDHVLLRAPPRHQLAASGQWEPDTARLCAEDCVQAPEYGLARDRGTRGDGAGRRRRTRTRRASVAFPVTLYKEQWITLLAMTDDIRAFLTEHDAELKTKSEA